jgi:membrane fusion protein, multidrug efflux system
MTYTKSRKARFLIIAALAASAAAGYAARWVTVLRYVESTDNAYAKADMISISPRVPGYVAEVVVRDNQLVKAGDPLVRIDSGDYAVKVEQLDAARHSQEAALATLGLQKTLQRSQIAQAQAAVQAAAAQRDKADADYKRMQALEKNGFVAREQLESRRSAVDIAAATLTQMQAELQATRDQLAISTGREEQLRADLRQSTAVAKQGQRDLHDTVIVAPADGVVGNRTVEVGQYVKTGTQLLSLVPAQHVYVVANFKETQIRSMHPGQNATISVDALSGAELQGVIDSLAPATGSEFSLLPSENATGNFTKVVQRVPVKVMIVPGQALAQNVRSGMSVNVSIDTRAAPAPARQAIAAR